MDRYPNLKWGRYEELRPDQLRHIMEKTPIAYWPLGLLEHHGWALPVGFDGVKAHRFAERMARRIGGVVLPVMWWGSGGGHGDFQWTFYQDADAGAKILETTVRGLINCGFKAIVIHAGHYPWQGIMDRVLAPIRDEHPEVLLVWGTEMNLAGNDLGVPGDHAARWEVSYGLALLPDLTDTSEMRPHEEPETAWPISGMPPEERRFKGVEFDATDPLFAQYGEDPRHTASAEAAEVYLTKIENRLVQLIAEHLKKA